MLRRTNLVWLALVIAVLAAVWNMPGIAVAQQTANVPKPLDKLAIGEDEVKELLLLMDTDNNGKVSRKEFKQFMEAEFERLDTDKSGELDVLLWRRVNCEIEKPLPYGRLGQLKFHEIGGSKPSAVPFDSPHVGSENARTARDTIHYGNTQHDLQIPFRPVPRELANRLREVFRSAEELARRQGAVLRKAGGDYHLTVGRGVEKA
jgi:hypothetical protein